MSVIEERFSRVNRLITGSLKSDVALISQLAKYIIMAGGKRLRPRLVLLGADACGYQGEDDIKLAAVIEFIHTATLLHDDVVDESALRRGRDTANEVFGNQAAVLTGDFLYSRSFQMMVEINNMQVMKILSDTTNVIAEGEVMQLMNTREPDISEDEYMEVIYCKTARLFESSIEIGALIAGTDKKVQDAFRNYGKHLGNAFQIIDDVLDYKSQGSAMGKNAGDDLAEGKVTLPLIHAMQTGSSADKEFIRNAILDEDLDKLPKIIEIIHRNESFVYCLARARSEVDKAVGEIETVGNSDSRAELIKIALESINRKF